MLIASCSDVHLDSRSHLFDDLVGVLNRSVDEALTHKPDLFVLAGDLTGRETNHAWSRQERIVWMTIVARIAQQCPIVGVPGNHDVADEVDVFRFILNATFATVPGFQAGAHLRPYTTSLEPAWPEIRQPGGLLVAHQPVQGILCGGFEISSPHDLELTVDYLDQLPVKAAILGHIHSHQRVGEKAWYCGSLTPLTFGDPDGKGYLLMDLNGDKPEVQLQPVTSWSMRTVEWPLTDESLAGCHVRCVRPLAATDPPLPERERDAMRAAVMQRGALSCKVTTPREQVTLGHGAAVAKATSDDEKLAVALEEKGIDPPERQRVGERFVEVRG